MKAGEPLPVCACGVQAPHDQLCWLIVELEVGMYRVLDFRYALLPFHPQGGPWRSSLVVKLS
jgi:hypothetical protein